MRIDRFDFAVQTPLHAQLFAGIRNHIAQRFTVTTADNRTALNYDDFSLRIFTKAGTQTRR
ncbi:hypothetical protein D3C73_1584110 [compost metagenome]